MARAQKYIPLDEPNLFGNEKKYLKQCIETNWISFQGPFVGRLEKAMASTCSTAHGITVVNGTYALVLALQSLGIGPEDEVIVPALTMSASIFCVSTLGAVPVFVDTLPDQMTIDPADVARKITKRTKAVIAVHLYGRVCDIDQIRASVGPDIAIIEDAAEALGAKYKGRPVGGLSTIACHSFHNKIVASGEGGAITLQRDDLALRVKDLRTPSPNNQGGAPILALNNRMSNVGAALALAQLERIEELVSRRKAVARAYEDCLKSVKGLRLFKSPSYEDCCFWRFQVLVDADYPLTRQQLIAALKARNIESREIFMPMHLHGFYVKKHGHLKLPNTAHVAARGLDLPSSPNLGRKDIERIADYLAHPKRIAA